MKSICRNTQIRMGRNTQRRKDGIMEYWNNGRMGTANRMEEWKAGNGEAEGNNGILEEWNGEKTE